MHPEKKVSHHCELLLLLSLNFYCLHFISISTFSISLFFLTSVDFMVKMINIKRKKNVFAFYTVLLLSAIAPSLCTQCKLIKWPDASISNSISIQNVMHIGYVFPCFEEKLQFFVVHIHQFVITSLNHSRA